MQIPAVYCGLILGRQRGKNRKSTHLRGQQLQLLPIALYTFVLKANTNDKCWRISFMFIFIYLKQELLLISSNEIGEGFVSFLCILLLIITRNSIKFIIKTELSGRNKFPLQNSIWQPQNFQIHNTFIYFLPQPFDEIEFRDQSCSSTV